MRDKRKQEEAERDLIGGGKSNEQAIKRFNESVKLKAPPASDSIKDTVNGIRPYLRNVR